MDDVRLTELRKLVGQHAKHVYEAVKTGMVGELPHESQLYAQAIQEHMHLKHIHNALEFADVREGEQYEIRVGSKTVNPMAHIAAHSAVKGQIEQDPLVRAIEAGKDAQKARTTYNRKIQKLIRDSAFRKNLTQQFSFDHSAFE